MPKLYTIVSDAVRTVPGEMRSAIVIYLGHQEWYDMLKDGQDHLDGLSRMPKTFMGFPVFMVSEQSHLQVAVKIQAFE